MLVFLDQKQVDANFTVAWKAGKPRHPLTAPRRPLIMAKQPFENMHFVDNMFVDNCWRQTENSTNPAHLLMGIGKLFVLATGHFHNPAPNKLPKFDLVLHHHCPRIDNWPWADFLDKWIWDYAMASGVLTANASQYFLPVKRDPLKREKLTLDPKTDMVVCGRNVFQAPFSVGKYLGNNEKTVVSKWNQLVDAKLNMNKNVARPNAPEALAHNGGQQIGGLSSSYSNCAKRLRVAVWRRTEGSALRRFVNMEAITSLVQNFTLVPLKVVAVNSTTPPIDQAALFRKSFDVLITPHGSHLANMVFGGQGQKKAYIELAAVPVDPIFGQNGRSFASSWIQSFGHAVHNKKELQARMPDCLATKDDSPGSPCPFKMRREFLQSDLIVNLTTLQTDLEQAAAVLCGNPTK